MYEVLIFNVPLKGCVKNKYAWNRGERKLNALKLSELRYLAFPPEFSCNYYNSRGMILKHLNENESFATAKTVNYRKYIDTYRIYIYIKI